MTDAGTQVTSAASPFSREEILEGLPARRAAALLYLIESRTAFLVARSRQAMERFVTDNALREREVAFVEAFALGRETPVKPTVQDLERFAAVWRPLVPDNPRIRAALAHLLGRKYRLVPARTAGIQVAVGWDAPDVAQAYQRLYRVSIGSLLAALTATERIRWAWAALASRLEALPPFWTAFSLTLTEIVGAGVLALPIVLAAIGPLGGLVILVILGLVNVLTIMAMSEAVARSGTLQYGNAFVGRVVSEYLGGAGSAILTAATAGICVSALIAYYIGFSLTLADATSLPPWFWTGVLFGVGIFFLSRGSLDTTVATALAVGAINLALVLALSALAVAHLDFENLVHPRVPFIGGEPFDPSVLGLGFGVVLVAYFGHLSVGNCARVVLARDPSARSLIWGSAAAQLVTIALYAIWVLAVSGAVPSEVLAAQSGTALAPLAREIGPVALVLGGVFVVLAMGMASIHYSLGLFNLVQERLPAGTARTVTVPRQGTMSLHPRRRPESRPRLDVTFVEHENDGVRLHVRLQALSGSHAEEVVVRDRWDSTALEQRSAQPSARTALLTLEVLDAWSGAVRLRVDSALALTFHGIWEPGALAPPDLLELTEPQARLVRWVIRRSTVDANEAAAFLRCEPGEARALMEEYVELGLLGRIEGPGEPRYRARFSARRTSRLPSAVWDAIGAPATTTAPPQRVEPRRDGRRLHRSRGLGARARFLLALAPTAAVFATAQWLFFISQEHFSKPLGYVGAISVSVLGGILPILLLYSSRRRGDRHPVLAYRLLGHPVTVASIYALFVVALLLHGTVIWQSAVPQAAAIIAAVVVLVFTIDCLRRRAFAPRAVLELRQPANPGSPAAIIVADGGHPVSADVHCVTRSDAGGRGAADRAVPPFGDLERAVVRVPASRSRELKIWVHRVTPENDSEGLAAEVELEGRGDPRRFELRAGGKPIAVPLAEGAFTVTVRPRRASPGATALQTASARL